jgi:carboxylate-amine ligase
MTTGVMTRPRFLPSGVPAGTRASEATALEFRPSAGPTLGVEFELMILDPETRDLAPGAVSLLEACAAQSVVGVSAELMQSMVEVKTGVCRDVAEVRDELFVTLRRVCRLTVKSGHMLALAGTHPFHRTADSDVYPDERYEGVLDRLAWLAYQRAVFDLHVHVGVPGGEEAVGVMDLVTPYLPHLLALSANSPFWHGADTGLASSRAALTRLLPHAGAPPYFEDWRAFCDYYRVMRECGALESLKDLHWDVRPRPDLGTVEFRICDTPATLAATLGLVALTRCLVVWALRELEGRPGLRRRDPRRDWIAAENRRLASRYGLDAPYIRTTAGERRPLAQDVDGLIERLLPIARETGDERFLAPFRPVARFEPGSTLQRRLYRKTGRWDVVMDRLALRLVLDLVAVAEGRRSRGRITEQRATA